MILGESCSRHCGFCAVTTGGPEPVDADEPRRVAAAAAQLGLGHVVITSVTRDDLDDGGASHFAATITAIRNKIPQSAVEVLTPDFAGNRDAIATVTAAKPDVYNHNVETVPALYATVRPGADYPRSLDLLATVKQLDRSIATKSGIMVGFGETTEQIVATLSDLRNAAVDMVTIGQYLQPTRHNLPVTEYVTPERFRKLREIALQLGFAKVEAGPYVRSSYHAAELFEQQDSSPSID
jgi:lipoic acid synthetase